MNGSLQRTLIFAMMFVLHLLPPANEVWGKVIFLHLFVILFTVGGCSWGVSGPGGCSRPTPKGEIEGDQIQPPPTTTAAVGTHPTGMHSCLTGKLHIF